MIFNEIIDNTSKIIISNADKIKLTLAAIFSEGSILIANYNNEKFLSRSINSCLNQNYTNLEIIIFDELAIISLNIILILP